MSETEYSALGLKWGIRVRKGLACKTCGRVLLHPANVTIITFILSLLGRLLKAAYQKKDEKPLIVSLDSLL